MTLPLRPWRWLTHGLLLLLAATLVACSSGGSDEPPPPPPPVTTGSVSGLVVSAATGQPLAGATARVGTLSAATGADGRFTLAGVTPGAVVVAITAPDHTSNFANATVVVGQTAPISTRLSRIGVRQTYSAAAGATVAVAGSPAQVVLPAGGIVDRNGVAFNGNVTVELSPIDPAADPANMPGDMTTRVGGVVQGIESFGAMAVVLTDAGGNRLNLAPGQTSTVRIPLSTRSPNPPATVPLFYFDEATGFWVQEGTATLQGSAPDQYYEGTVSHFTVWNADQVVNTVTVSGCVRDTANAPVAGAVVRSDGLDYSGTASAVTNAAGEFSVAMRRGSQASIFASIDARFSNSLTAGPSEGPIVLPNCLAMGNGAPVFVVQPAPQSVTEGGFAVFQAIARGTAPLRYQWQRNGVDIAGATTTVLLVDPVSNADAGATYRAVATNNVGTATSDGAVLTVASLPPAIAVQPQPQAVVAGAAATFTVQMQPQGAPLQFQWRRNGNDIPGATSASYTLATTALSDSGASFSVRISNAVGAVVSDAATLTVTAAPVAPSIGTQPANVSVNVGQSAQFTVVASGSAPLRYEWRRGSTVIATATGPTLTLATTTLADSGAVFSVVVSNDAGSVTSANATLTVTEPPASAGLYLVASAGAIGNGSMVFANGAQTFSSQALLAVAADNPAAGAATVEVAGAATYPFAWLIDATLQGNTLSNLRQRYSFYFKNARLMRLDHVSPGGAPAGQAVSSLTSGAVCAEGGFPMTPDGLSTLDDAADPGRAWVLLMGPGADNQCFSADDTVLAVRANMSGTTAPVTVPGVPVQEIVGADGSLAGVIVRAGQVLRRLDANFANPVDLHTLTGTGSGFLDDFVFGSSTPGIWVFLDGGVLYGYALDGSSGAPRALVTLTAEERARSQIVGATQGGRLYLAISDGTASRIVRIAGDLSVTASGSGPGTIAEMLASPTRLVFLEGQTLSAQPLAGGTRTTLASPTSAGDFINGAFLGGETVYFSRINYQQGEGQPVGSVGIVNTDGSNPQTLAATSIVTVLAPASLSVSEIYDQNMYALVLAQGLTGPGQYAGATLSAIATATRSTLVSYGTLPAQPSPSFLIPGFGPFQYGQPGLLTLFAVQAQQEASDLFFFDSDAPGLVRVTNSIATPSGAALRPATRLGVPAARPARVQQPGLLGLGNRPAAAAPAAVRR